MFKLNITAIRRYRYSTDTIRLTQWLRPRRSGARQVFSKVGTDYKYGQLCVYIYKRASCWNPHSNTMEADRPQHDRPTAGVIGQQYSSTTFVSLRFHPHTRKNSVLFFKNTISIMFTYLKMSCLKSRNLKLRKSLSVCVSNKPRPLRPKQSSFHYSFIILPWAATVWTNDSVSERVIDLYVHVCCVCVCVDNCNILSRVCHRSQLLARAVSGVRRKVPVSN